MEIEKAILEQLVQLSGQIGELKSEMRQGFKDVDKRFQEQDSKIEILRAEMQKSFKTHDARFKALQSEMQKGFEEQKQISEKLNHDLLWNMEDASDIILGFYHELNDKINNNYDELRKAN